MANRKFNANEIRMMNRALALYLESTRQKNDLTVDGFLHGALACLIAYFGKENIGSIGKECDGFVRLLDEKANVFYGCYPCALHY